jgi:hypothetical protein
MKTVNFIIQSSPRRIVSRPQRGTVPTNTSEGTGRGPEALTSLDSGLRHAGMTAWLLAFCLLPFAMPSAFAADPGTTTGELLKIPDSARAVGMGEAYTAAADDSSALYWNPAGLSFAQQKDASFMETTLIENVNYEHLSFAAPGDNYSFGTSLSYLGFGSIQGYDNNPAGGQPTGNVTAYSYDYTAGISAFVMDRLSLGLTGSYLREDLANTNAGTFAANVGAMYGLESHPLEGDYRLGLSALNLGPGLKYVTDSAPLPRKIAMGAEAMHVGDIPLNLTADFTMPNDNSNYISVGSEYWFKEIVAFRLGYTDSNDVGRGLRLGMGLKLREFLFDYAYGSFGDFGVTNRIELSYKWGEKIHQLNKEQRAVLKEAKRAGDQGDYVQQILAMNELLEKDPTNDRILKKMIAAHEHMLQVELKDAVAQSDSNKEIPSPEESALQDLVPGQEAVAQSQGFDPKDPLGLNNLPDATSLEALQGSVAPSPGVVPAPSAPPAVETKPSNAPAAAPAAAPANDGVLLNPSDIYGN